ncbi:MAG: endolytic transglycosylase MltG [bacterium]|nr:endolytic transglycosylase MltG [bacterium]
MKLKKIWKIIFGLLLICIIGGILLIFLYNYELSPVDSSDKVEISFTIKPGVSTKNIAKNLMDAKLIHNDNFFVIYLKLHKINNLQASTYKLNRAMNMKNIIKIISNGEGYNPNEIKITFKDGKNIKNIATIISENTNNSYEDVISKAKDISYLDKIIEKYWFVDNSIKNNNLYYPLEGLLFPNTYIFSSKDVSIEEIFDKMLAEMDNKLSLYKNDIEKSKYSVFEILTLASLVEKEGKTKDFSNIASTFINRLNKGMNLSSCASAYYGVGMDFNEIGIATSDMINNKNNYNTYIVKGLPAGPISSVSADAIESVIKPKSTDYLYFLSDNEGNTYFFKTYSEHQNKEKELKKEGKWQR